MGPVNQVWIRLWLGAFQTAGLYLWALLIMLCLRNSG